MVGCRKRSNTGGRGYGQNHPYMQCRGSRRAFTTAGAPFHAVSRHEKAVFLDHVSLFPFSLSQLHYVGRSFSPSESIFPSVTRAFGKGQRFPAENFTVRKFSAGNRRENAQIRGDGGTLMKKVKITRPVNAFPFPQMASHISFSIFSSLWDRTSMSLLIFWLVIRAYIWVVFKSV